MTVSDSSLRGTCSLQLRVLGVTYIGVIRYIYVYIYYIFILVTAAGPYTAITVAITTTTKFTIRVMRST